MILGDSLEYEFFDEAIQLLKNPIGVSVEIGVRRGMGTKCIIDAYRKYHPSIELKHLGIDPYGNILYRTSDNDKGGRLDYTNKMKQDALLAIIKEYPEFNFVNLEDSEFFKRYADGYPIYDFEKKLLTQYETVHFDGPHNTESVMNEVNFFLDRRPKQCVYIFDDIDTHDIDKIGEHLIWNGFKQFKKGNRKAVFI
ncbi:MAG: hypothetical protein EB044_05950, partial [Actinobacteria bacterium]|nr:hypothetical protein [Actinomycetota bacterium]